MVSSCAVLFGIPNINSGAGMDTLVGILGASGFGQLNAFCLMIFCLLLRSLCSGLATIRKESGSTRWMLFSALFQLVVAWAVTFVVYRVGLFAVRYEYDVWEKCFVQRPFYQWSHLDFGFLKRGSGDPS